jgi:putative membrane protein
MRTSMAFSAAVLAAASMCFAADPASNVPQQNAAQAQQQAQQAAQDAQQRAQQGGRDIQDRAERSGHEIRGEAGTKESDEHFIKGASSDNQLEIQAGQMVAQQAQNPQVKQLAERLVQDHQQSQQELQQLAQGMNMQLPTELMPAHQARLQEMQKMRGEAMERGFVFDQVGDHTKDILCFQYEAEHAMSPELKQFAQKNIPVLEQHLRMAQEAAEQWVPQARTAGERLRGTGDDARLNRGGASDAQDRQSEPTSGTNGTSSTPGAVHSGVNH